jgi:nucleoid-associated protein YgaU
MQLVKLTIAPCVVTNGDVAVFNGKKFTVMINPAKYSHSYAIRYSHKAALGQTGSASRFHAIEAETVSFDLVLDGTGVVSADAADVKTQIQQLNGVVYNYDGNNHEPNHVRLLWGSFIFFGRLTKMSASYSLFKPSGEPLRAVISVTFRGFMSKEEESLRANRSSPDLSHTVEVQAGDTLPLLCHRIYKDAAYYPEVARANNIVDFRNLKPGLRLHFPPLI